MFCRMPVPKPGADAPPRKLLRDVVYDRIRTEILSGQFEAGERLNDETLIEWLGVSRTPIREALGRLAADGLVETEANRYTQIPNRSPEAYARAAEYMHMVRGFILEHLFRVPAGELSAARRSMTKLLPKLREHDRAAQVEFNEVFGALAGSVQNALIVEAEERVRGQAQFHLQHEDSEIHWDNIIGHAERLVA
jgi:DNA-binding GntR family transcriptional regulator